MNKIIIEYLFPEVSNLYGDPFNVKYLEKCILENGVECEIIKDELNKEPFFVKEIPSFAYLGPMTEHSQELVIDRLKPYKERIKELIDKGVIFFITGNAIEVFEERIECEDGSSIEGLSLFPYNAKRKMFSRYNSLFLGEYEGIKIVGNKSQFTHSYGDTRNYPFIKVIRGDGLAPTEAYEGFRENNFMATYLLGPLLPLNPLLTKYVLAKLGISNPVLSYEKEAMKAYEIRLKEFENEQTELS